MWGEKHKSVVFKSVFRVSRRYITLCRLLANYPGCLASIILFVSLLSASTTLQKAREESWVLEASMDFGIKKLNLEFLG